MDINKIALYTKGAKYMSCEELMFWCQVFRAHNIEGYINRQATTTLSDEINRCELQVYDEDKLPSNVDMIISYGGDGTILSAVDLYHQYNIPFLAINSGRMGFLASLSRDDVSSAIEDILNGNFEIDKRSLLRVESDELGVFYGFNEFTLQKSSLGMVKVSVDIDDEFVADYMSDGLIISTPTGSTAYSMSVGGPIVTPECDCLVVNPIAPHNLNMRPLVVGDKVRLRVKGSSRTGELLCTIDNRDFAVANDMVFYITKLKSKVSLIKIKNSSFYSTIREKLLWGIEKRTI